MLADISTLNTGPFVRMLQEPQLLLPIYEEEPSYALFRKAMGIAFDVHEDVMADIQNFDLLWRPELDAGGDAGQVHNYYTLASGKTSERDPIYSMLSYLFEPCEPYYEDPYELGPGEASRLEACHRHLRQAYGTPDDYFGAVGKRLYRRGLDLRGMLSEPGRRKVATVWAESI